MINLSLSLTKKPRCSSIWIHFKVLKCCLVTNFQTHFLKKPVRILQQSKWVSCEEEKSDLTLSKGWKKEEGDWWMLFFFFYLTSFDSTPHLPLFLSCMPLTEDWLAESEMDCWPVAFHADNAIWWRRGFDEAPAYNERIKRWKPRLILPGEKLSSVITSSLHVVRRGLNAGRGFTEKSKWGAERAERETAQSELR